MGTSDRAPMPSAELGSDRRRSGRHAMLCSLRYPTSGIAYDGARLAAVRPGSGPRLLVETGARYSAPRLQLPSDIQYPIRYLSIACILEDGSVRFRLKRAGLQILALAEMSRELPNETCCTRDLISRSHVRKILKRIRSPRLTSFFTPVVSSSVSNHRRPYCSVRPGHRERMSSAACDGSGHEGPRA